MNERRPEGGILGRTTTAISGAMPSSRCCLKGWRIFAQLRMAIGFTMITMKWKAFPARKRGRTSPVHSRLNLQSLELRRAQGAPRLQPKICREAAFSKLMSTVYRVGIKWL